MTKLYVVLFADQNPLDSHSGETATSDHGAGELGTKQTVDRRSSVVLTLGKVRDLSDLIREDASAVLIPRFTRVLLVI